MIRNALFSNDKKHRYFLERVWNDSLETILFVLLNPSIADSKKDDPTIKKLISFSKKWGYGGFCVCNLYSYRTPSPKELYNNSNNKSKKNKEYLKNNILKSNRVIYGWGATEFEPKWILDLVKEPLCFGKNKNGTPKHPLYMNYKTKLIKYR